MAKRLFIGLVVASTFRKRDDVVTNGGYAGPTCQCAHHTERLLIEEALPHALELTPSDTGRLMIASPCLFLVLDAPLLSTGTTGIQGCGWHSFPFMPALAVEADSPVAKAQEVDGQAVEQAVSGSSVVSDVVFQP